MSDKHYEISLNNQLVFSSPLLGVSLRHCGSNIWKDDISGAIYEKIVRYVPTDVMSQETLDEICRDAGESLEDQED